MTRFSRFIIVFAILTSPVAAQTDTMFTDQGELPEFAFAAGSPFPSLANGGGLDLSWYTIDGGGAMWTSDRHFELSGTVGQPDAGVIMAAGDFEVTGGFWAVAGTGGESCPADFDGDGDVDTADLLFLLGAWGTPEGDVDGDEDTDTADLLALLAAWGECP
jgi:hypothetical protein